MAEASPMSLLELEKDPRLFLYTSLTAGSSHIITATSRLETILKANKIPFQAIDMATDEKARRLWQRRAGGRKLPGLVKEGFVIGDLAEVEEWNEFGELKENIGPVPANNAAPTSGGQTGVNIAPPSRFAGSSTTSSAATTSSSNTTGVYGQTAVPAARIPEAGFDKTKGYALPGAAEIAARAAKALETAKAAVVPDSSKTEVSATAATDSKDTKAEADKDKTSGERSIPLPQRKTSISFASGTAGPKSPSSNSINAGVGEKKAAKEESAPAVAKPKATDTAVEPSTDITVPTHTGATQDIALSAPVAVPSTASPDDSAKSPPAVTSPSPTHRGSEVKAAPPEVIRRVEESQTLAESKEEEEVAAEAEGSEHAAAKNEKETTLVKDVEEKLKDLGVADALTEEATTTAAVATPSTAQLSSEAEADTKAEAKTTQEQDPKEPADASKSVED